MKRGRKPGRGGRGRRGGRGGRQSSSGGTPIGAKRDRSPLSDSPKSVRGKSAKLISSNSVRKSIENLRSLRPRSVQPNSDNSLDETLTDGSTHFIKADNQKSELDENSKGPSHNEVNSIDQSVSQSSGNFPTVHKPQVEAAVDSNSKKIPRLIDITPGNRREALAGVTPLEWTTEDVAQFLRANDYTAYCEAFTKAVRC